MVLFIPKKAIYTAALAVVLVTLAAVAPRPPQAASAAAPVTPAVSQTTPVLDAGHGGEDGGAVSDSGVAESGINLQITRRLYEILRLLGHPSVMTRTGDDAVYAEISSGGKIVRTVNLRIDQQFTVTGETGGSNTVTVRDGRIAVTAADCPDHYCMERGFCSSGTPIVCLPNRLVIQFRGEQSVDAAAG